MATLGAFRKAPGHRDALRRVKLWTRARFGLSDDTAILVTEIACALPGCPPLETIIAFWPEDEKRRHFKIFKPTADVVEDDLPPAWMKNALVADDGAGCDCC